MKSRIIILIFVCSTFFSTSSYAAYECFILKLYDTQSLSGSDGWNGGDVFTHLDDNGDLNINYDSVSIGSSETYVYIPFLYYAVSGWNGSSWDTTYTSGSSAQFTNDSWDLLSSLSASSGGIPVTHLPYDTTNFSTLYPNGCSDLPPPPCDENQLQIDADDDCLGLVDWVDPEICDYKCIDSGCPELQSACNDKCGAYADFTCTEDVAGNVIDYDCQCDDCSLETESWAESNCGGLQYLDWYDCDLNDGACLNRSCNDALQDCSDKCGGSIAVYSCDNSSGTASNVICTCDGDLDQENDGLPDNTGDPLTDPDPVNDDEQDPEPDDTDSGFLAKIVTNTKATSENTKALHSLVDRELNELNKNTTDTNNLLRNTNKSIDNLEDKLDEGFELSGSASYQADNSFDTSITQPEENSLTDTIGNYITAGLPLQQFLSDSGFTVSNLDPSMDCELWGYTVEFDVSPMEPTLNWMGLVVFAVSTISAFMIVIKR